MRANIGECIGPKIPDSSKYFCASNLLLFVCIMALELLIKFFDLSSLVVGDGILTNISGCTAISINYIIRNIRLKYTQKIMIDLKTGNNKIVQTAHCKYNNITFITN